jgi:hypothetical protein
MIGLIAPYIFTTWDYRQYSAIFILHTFQFTITHALGFSAFISRILATDSSQSYCNFNSHMKYSGHSLILLLPFLLNHVRLPSPELGPILFLLDYLTTTLPYSPSDLLRPFITPRHGSHYCKGIVFTVPFPSNRRLIVAFACVTGNVLTDPLPSNGYTGHNIISLTYWINDIQSIC